MDKKQTYEFWLGGKAELVMQAGLLDVPLNLQNGRRPRQLCRHTETQFPFQKDVLHEHVCVGADQ